MGRYNFVSPGAEAAQAIQALMLQRQEQERRDRLEAQAREDRKANQAIQQRQIAVTEANQRQSQEKAAADSANEAAATAYSVSPTNADVDPMLAAIMAKSNKFAPVIEQKQTLPSRSMIGALPTPATDQGQMQGPSEQASGPAPGVLAQSADAGGQTFSRLRPTAAQQEEQRKRAVWQGIIDDPRATPEQKIAARWESGDGGQVPTELLKNQDEQEDVYTVDPRTNALTKVGSVKKGSHISNVPAPSGDSGGRPYTSVVQSGEGILVLDGRTGSLIRRYDLKPGETAQKEIANAQTISTITRQVLNSMDPAKIGPAMGRYKTAEALLSGGDPEFAQFAAAVTTLKNTVVNLRTGAAMSEPEAGRILQEVADVNLPPATFMARAKQAQLYFDEWLKNRASVAYGRTTEADVDKMTGKAATTPAGTTPGGGGAAAPGGGGAFDPAKALQESKTRLGIK